jgi:hypothetical protein
LPFGGFEQFEGFPALPLSVIGYEWIPGEEKHSRYQSPMAHKIFRASLLAHISCGQITNFPLWAVFSYSYQNVSVGQLEEKNGSNI